MKFSNPGIWILLLTIFLIKIFMIQYGLPFQTHVDEWTIIKDPLKILLQYKEGNFSTGTNLYNYILTGWHVVVFGAGLLLNKWNNFAGFTESVSENSPFILFSFRFLNVIISMTGLWIWIKLFERILINQTFLNLVLIALFAFNPFEINSTNWVKFDAICFLFYGAETYIGYRYFIEKKSSYRKYIYILPFIATATRIENVAFLAGYAFYDFAIVHQWSLKKYFDKYFFRTISLSIVIYSFLTLFFLPFLNTSEKISYTKTNTFEEVILSLLDFNNINYFPYLKYWIVLLSPLSLVIVIWHFFNRSNAVNKLSFLILPFVVITIVLSLDGVKNLFYFLASSCIILFVVICQINYMARRKVGIIAGFLLLYFISYDLQLLYYTVRSFPGEMVDQAILNKSVKNDTILLDGVVPYSIIQTPSMLSEKISSIKEIGGGTGKGLEVQYQKALKDSANCRNLFQTDPDYYWKGTKWENKWLIGKDTARIEKLRPRLVVVSIFDNTINYNRDGFYNYLRKKYAVKQQFIYSFTDPRLNYRTHYYFHSIFVFARL